VHSREAKDDTINILSEEAAGLKGVLHCFSGDQEMAWKTIEMGLHISIAGPVTFKNATELRDISKTLPDERLLIETDAPYLSPAPMRGKRNEPSFIKYTVKELADIRGVNMEDISRITTLNAMRLFNIGSIPEKGEMAYRIRDSLYLNVTDRCTNRCGFCVRSHTSYIKGHNLKLEKEPSAEELIKAVGEPGMYKEVVFCGLGEPFLRLDLIKRVARWVKEQGGIVRVNTNGHGNAINNRNILPELDGLVDSISISLDAEDEETYQKICKPLIKNSFTNVISFIKESKKHIPDVNVTVVRVPEIDIEKCKEIARDLGVGIRVREYDVVG
jgi:TatD DNase family protein